MNYNFKNIIFFYFLFSFPLIFGKQIEHKDNNSIDMFLESSYIPKSIENINLFNIQNDNFEDQTFQAPY